MLLSFNDVATPAPLFSIQNVVTTLQRSLRNASSEIGIASRVTALQVPTFHRTPRTSQKKTEHALSTSWEVRPFSPGFQGALSRLSSTAKSKLVKSKS
jgi:hypothetical protein